MKFGFSKSQLALAAVAAIASSGFAIAPTVASAAGAVGKTAGQYVAGDFHNHTTCSDGSISMQKLVKKVTDKSTDSPWGLDWFVQAGHGGTGNRNCTLVEDASLSTPAYPMWPAKARAQPGPIASAAPPSRATTARKLATAICGAGSRCRSSSTQCWSTWLRSRTSPCSWAWSRSVAGHEHSSMTIITGQMPAALDGATLPNSPGYTPLGNANALAQWSYCFDRNDTDKSRGNVTGSAIGNNWNCSVNGSANAADPSWNATAQKLIPAGGAGTGNRGHLKTVEAIKWMAQNHANGSYYVPAHLERAGPFNPDGNNGFNVEHLRNFNNAGPDIAFGFETQPGHGASSDRGEYYPGRNSIGGVLVDSVGGTTWGGTGVYGAQVGGVWDALLGEGRNFWFFASSDWHNRGSFGPDDRRSTQDFYPGEYQRNYTLVRNGADKLRPQTIVDGLRSGNNFASSGQLIDRLAFVACASYAGPAARTNAQVEALAVAAATNNRAVEASGCATMGEKLVVRPGAEIIVTVVVRDPAGSNYSPYTFPNPSLKQVGITQALNKPVLDHIDLVRGLVTGYKTPGTAGYAGQWPNTWLANPDLATVPAAAKNTSAAVIKTFSGNGGSAWTVVASGVDNSEFLKMTYRIPAVQASQYVRLRGSNLPASVPFETDANGSPLADVHTNARSPAKLKIACTTVGTTEFDGCPSHLPVVNGQKMVANDIAAWSDLWFYSNPIYVQVNGATVVAGVK